MNLGAPEDFTADELKIVQDLARLDPELQAAQEAGEIPAPADGEQGDVAPTEQADPKQQEAPKEERPQGDLRQALRASRRAERQARERATALEAELERVRKGETSEVDPDAFTAEELAEMEESLPAVAKIARQLAKVRPQEKKEEPVAVPDDPVQDAIDDVPELLAWQSSEDSTLFESAKAMDLYVSTLPAWTGKPLAERFAHVVKRVKEDRGAAAAPDPTPEAPKTRSPSTLSDLGAGAAPEKTTLNLERMMKMSEDDIMTALLRQGG